MATPQPPSSEFGRVLREQGRKQVWLADRLGVDQALVSHWVHGLTVPDDMRGRIAELLGRDEAELFPDQQVLA
jgi:predicted transcriptional regulator